jgi:hypothetical protein
VANVLRLLRALDRAICRVGGSCCVSRANGAWQRTRPD